MDSYMNRYHAVLSHALSGLGDKSVIDFGAGSGWIRSFGFQSYQGLDIEPASEPWSERWNFDDALPERFLGKHDVAVSLNALHYALNPNRTLESFLSALSPGGMIVLSVPWLYPPHDREIDCWRMSPKLLYRILNHRFEQVSLFPVGSFFNLPARVFSRYLRGPFHGFEKGKPPVSSKFCEIRPSSEKEIPTSFFGPLTTVAVGKGFLESGGKDA